MITERDLAITVYLEQYKYATIEQLEKIFFKEQQYSYNIARRRLAELKKSGYIKVYRDTASNKNIYIWNDEKVKIPSAQRLKLLDVLAELKYSDFEVELFEIEKFWMDGKIRSDGLTIFKVNDRRYHFFIEIQISNHPHNLKKYDDLYKSGEVQRYLNKDFFPRVLFICDRQYKDINLEHARIVQLNTKLNAFPTILL